MNLKCFQLRLKCCIFISLCVYLVDKLELAIEYTNMSSQPPHWVRRNVSPASAKQGPVRATVPVSLMRQSSASPTKNANKRGSPSSSPISKACGDNLKYKNRQSPDEKRTARSPGSRGEKAKTLNLKSQTQEHFIRRTASLDAIYLASQWQQDAIFLGYCGHLMIDKATQTPEEWDEADKRKLQKKLVVTSGDQLEVKYIRQRLQRTNQNSRSATGLLSSQRHSPIQGDHSAISTSSNSLYTAYLAAPSTTSTQQILHSNQHTGTVVASSLYSVPIPISHCPKPFIPRMQNSVEGLNQEIEKLVLKECPGADKEEDLGRLLEPTPEGHRAPIAELFHSSANEDVQAHFAGRDSCPSSGTTSRSHSISPATPFIPGNSDCSVSPHSEEQENVHKLGTSPHINQFLARGPPDGCEKVKIVEEPRKCFSEQSSSSTSLKPSVTFVLLPSQSSAFCPLYKGLKSATPPFDSFTLVSSTQTADRHQ